MGGVNPSEWLRQIELKREFPENFGTCFGLHPYFVSDHSVEDCEAALDQLALVLPQAMALGETGLDFRPHIMKDSQILQIEMFESQIELAKAFHEYYESERVLTSLNANQKLKIIEHFKSAYEAVFAIIGVSLLERM